MEFPIKSNWLSKSFFLLFLACLTCYSGCREKPGDPLQFESIPFDQLTEKNAPKGVVFRDGKIQLADGYSLVPSSDSTQALIIGPGNPNGGSLTMRCECDDVLTIGCIVVLDEILTCRSLLCAKCKPALQSYNGFIRKDRF